MKYFTKENILLALVSLLVLAKANDLRQSRRGPERSRGAIMERMRGMDRSDWGPRMDAMRKARKGTAEEVVLSISPGVTCCTQKN
jgi:hypothetical protein